MNLQNQKKYNKLKFSKYSQKKYFDRPIAKIIFVHNYSVKDDILHFTNFFQRVNCKRNIIIKEVINKCVENPNFFKSYFYGNEVSLKTKRDIYKKRRLHNIIALYNHFQANDDKLFKYVPNDLYLKRYGAERGLQFIFEHKNEEILVYLIDLYHLAIPSAKDKKKEKMSLSYEYENKKNYQKGIEEVIFDKIETH